MSVYHCALALFLNYELFLQIEDHQGKVPDLCELCHKHTVDSLYNSKFFEMEDETVARALAKLAKLYIPKVIILYFSSAIVC